MPSPYPLPTSATGKCRRRLQRAAALDDVRRAPLIHIATTLRPAPKYALSGVVCGSLTINRTLTLSSLPVSRHTTQNTYLESKHSMSTVTIDVDAREAWLLANGIDV